jgi:alpha-galactosidase
VGPPNGNLRIALEPGEAFDLPEILLCELPNGDPVLGAPRLHRFVLRRLFARAKSFAPFLYNTWFGCYDKIDPDWARAQLAAAAEIGCEVFVVDAGWFGEGTSGWVEQVGDWREKKDGAFRGRMSEFADEARAAGLGFGLWMEPERVAPSAPLAGKRPAWLLPSHKGSFRFDLAVDEARRYLFDEVCRLVETYRAAWIKIDFNSSLGPDPSGRELSGYFARWYEVLDELRSRYPETFFEGCSSGGLRLDLNALRRFDGHFLSDNVTPVDALRIYQGTVLRIPPGRIGMWAVLKNDPHRGVVAPNRHNWEGAKVVDVDFAARIALLGMFGVSGDIASLPADARDRLRRHGEFYKRVRRFTAGACAHLLTGPSAITDTTGWVGIQLSHPPEDVHLLFAARLDDPSDDFALRLRDLDPARTYRVTTEDGEPFGNLPGSRLMDEGIRIRLRARQSAELLTLSPVLLPASSHESRWRGPWKPVKIPSS